MKQMHHEKIGGRFLQELRGEVRKLFMHFPLSWRHAKRNGIVVHVLANCIGPKPNVFVRWFANIYGCLAEKHRKRTFSSKKIRILRNLRLNVRQKRWKMHLATTLLIKPGQYTGDCK